MSLVLCTLALNEAEWLPSLYLQHRDWPGMLAWIFVEGADAVYAKANPDMVTPEGLSVDGTTEFLAELARVDPRVTHIKHGLGKCDDPAQGKCGMRQRYLGACEEIRPDYLLILDSDEFYTRNDQAELEGWMRQERHVHGYNAYCFKYRHLWRPPSIAQESLTALEVVGGFWQIAHCHGWKWYPGMRYTNNHMTPQADGHLVRMVRLELGEFQPQCVHTAFASQLKGRVAKHRYYAERGEANDRRRRWYVESRAAFEVWQPGDRLPRGARVIPYTGPVPEVFQEKSHEDDSGL